MQHSAADIASMHNADALADKFWRNSTVLFVGDSINQLLGTALECEVAKARLADWALVENPQDVKPSLLTASSRLLERLQQLHDFNKGVNMPEGSWWVAPLVSHARGTIVVRKGYGRYNATSLDLLLPLVNVAVINFGLHYGRPSDEYVTDMQQLFTQLDAWVRAGGVHQRHGVLQWRRRALFRETSAQHFVGTGSFRDMSQARPDSVPEGNDMDAACRCEAMTPELLAKNEVKRQNEAVARIASAYTSTVGIVPFYDLTAPRYDMHEGPFCGYGARTGPTPCCDCTHFCYTPQLWRTWFNTLYQSFAALPPAAETGAGTGSAGNGTVVDGVAISEHAVAQAEARVDALMERLATQAVAAHHTTAKAPPPSKPPLPPPPSPPPREDPVVTKPPTPTPPAGMKLDAGDDEDMQAWLAEDDLDIEEEDVEDTELGFLEDESFEDDTELVEQEEIRDAPEALLIPSGLVGQADAVDAPHNVPPERTPSNGDKMQAAVAALRAMHPAQAGAVLAVLEVEEAAPLVMALGGETAGTMLANVPEETAHALLHARNESHVFVTQEVSAAGWQARQKALSGAAGR